MNRIGRGKVLESKSLTTTLTNIQYAFREMCGEDYSCWIIEVYEDYIISQQGDLPAGNFYKIGYTIDANEQVTFDAQENWQVVELDYTPVSITPVQESKLTESAKLLESRGKSIKAHGLTANVVTINRTLYPRSVLQAAVNELKGSNRLNESTGQGKIRQLLGEVEHPADKKQMPSLNEAAFKWNDVYLDDQDRLIFEGKILPTPAGQLITGLIESGVEFGFSIRGNGEIKESRDNVAVVTELRLTGLDAVLDPSDTRTKILEIKESKNKTMNQKDLLLSLMRDYANYFTDVSLQEAASYTEDQAINRLRILRASLQISESANLVEALMNDIEQKAAFNAQREQAQIAESVAAAKTVARKFGDLKDTFIQQLDAKQFTSLQEANSFIEAQKSVYEGLTAQARLGGGNSSAFQRIKVTPPLEVDVNNTPEFARAAFEIKESVRQRGFAENGVALTGLGNVKSSDANRNQKFAIDYLRKFDKKFETQLLNESRQLQEAVATADLSLPYSVNRALIELAVPTLVGTSIFDVAVAETSPTVLYFNKAMTAETGLIATATAEAFVVPGSLPAAVQLAHKRIVPGSVAITGKVENTDFMIDYANGKLWLLAGYTTPTTIDYSYYSIREGEMAPINRMKQTLSNMTITAQYDRIAVVIPHEAIAFSKSQMGLDLVALSLKNLSFELAKIIDSGLMRKATFSARIQGASNVAGTYSLAANAPATLADHITSANVKLQKRYYTPDFILMGLSNAQHLSKWDALTANGARNGVSSNLNGFIGTVNGVPVFTSTEAEDGAGSAILVGNREVVQFRMFEPMQLIDAGFVREQSSGKAYDAREWFLREGNATESVIPEKVSYVKVTG